ncbi:MAG: M4 family metallopeptidase [Crocinitomicaceae bacterium]
MTLKKPPLSLLAAILLFSNLVNGQQIFKGEKAREIISFAKTVRTSPLTDIPSYIEFDDSQQLTVEAVFALLKKKYKLNSEYGFILLNEHTDKMNHVHYRFQQTFNGKPIETGVILMHVKNDIVYSLNGLGFNSISSATNASISESSALNLAKNFVGAETYKWEIPAEEDHLKAEQDDITASYFPKGNLVYMQPKLSDKNLRLAYKFNIYAHHPVSRQEIYVDALNGEIIFVNKIIKHIDVPGTATTGYSNVRTIVTDSTSATNYRLRESGRGNGVETYNMLQGTNYASAVDFTDTDNNWTNVNTNLDQYATDAHWGSEVTYDYYNLEHSRNSIDNAGFALKNYIHYDVNYNNAFWDGSRMTFGDGNGTTTTPLVALDISGHEVTHGLTTFTANLVYQDESGGLNESFSDIFGTCIENYGRPTDWNWTIGEDIGITIRSMSNPGTYGDPDTYMGTNWIAAGGPDNGGVHSNSGVQNYWFYLLTDGGSGTNDNGDAYTVTGQGFTTASEIAFRNLTMYLTPSSTFADARFYAIQSAVDLFGSCSPEVEATTNAWYAVGVGNPYVPYALADFTSDTLFCSAPISVNFQNLSINGTSFTWDFGDGTSTSSALNPSHTYSATGTYDVSLIADGGTCGIDTLILTNHITIDNSVPCVITFPQSGIAPTQSACDGTIYDSGGITGNYGNMEDAEMTIAPLGADSVELFFTSFAIEPGNGPTCNYDYLEVYDGNSSAAPLLATYCDNNPPPASITSTGNAMTIVFHSDQSLTYSGFQLDWQCHLSNTPPIADFESQDTSTCSGNVQFTDLSANGPTSWLWSFGDNNTSTMQNPVHTYSTSGIYTVKLVTSNTQGSDSITYTNYIDVDLLNAPTVFGDSVCENQTGILTASGIGVPNWYAAMAGGSILDQGNTFTTPVLTANTTYYVSDYQAGPNFTAGAPSSAIGTGGYFNGDQGLIFNCTQACTLRTVDVVAGSAGNRTIELRNSAGTVLQSVTVNIPNTPNQFQTIVLDMPIPVGNNLVLGTANGSNPDLYRNNSGGTYPYTSSNGIISITGTTATASGYYYFFYNWDVESPGCESDRVPILAEVFPDFNLSITNVPAIACSYQTAIQLSANTPSGQWSANCANCIDANTGVFQPNQAGIGAWAVSYTASNNCEKTVTEYIVVESCLGVDENEAPEISIFPNPSHSNVTIALNADAVNSVVITDVSGKTIERFITNSNQIEVNASAYESGLYFFNFLNTRGESIKVEKFIKE